MIQNIRGQELRRAYSLLSSPVLDEPLSIGVKRIANGSFSRWLVDKAAPGNSVLTIGAGGLFTLPEKVNSYATLFFFAAGSGITPVLSLVKTALYGHADVKVVLVYSNHSPDTAAYLQAVRELEQTFAARFRLMTLFSIDPDLRRAHLNRELLFAILDQNLADSHSALFYCCGPAAYQRFCTYLLQERGIIPGAIRKENFIPVRNTAMQATPPDTQAHVVSLHYKGAVHRFSVQYPDTILSGAKRHGISLPYSCEAGVCGSCAAHCREGKVWLAQNEVLTPEDLAKGLVLTCVGYPVGGDITLDI